MPWFWALIAKQKRVEMMTHIRGAPAETQNSFGFLILTCLAISSSTKKQIPITIVCHDHSCILWKTELITGTRPISLVKCVIPSKLLSCCKDTIIAAPAMNPIKIAFDKKSMINPNLRIPSEAWNRPAKKVEVRASCRNRTGSAEGDTSCLSMDPKTRDAIETGPTARSLELPRTA